MVKAYVPGRHEDQAGIYVLFEMVVQNAVAEGARGIVAMPFTADWGPIRQFREMQSNNDAKEEFGTGKTASLLDLAFRGNPVAIKGYRMATETAKKAETTFESIKVVALYEGERGNGFQVTIRPSLSKPTYKELLLIEGVIVRDLIEFSNVDELVEKSKDSRFIRVEKVTDTMPSDTTGNALTGGNSGHEVTADHYAEFLYKAEAEQFNAITTDGVDDESIRAMFVQFIRDMRPLGKLVKFYTGGGNATDIDYYAVTNVKQWVEYNGKRYEPAQWAPYVASIASSCPLNESIALRVTPFSNVQSLTNIEMKESIRDGNLVLFKEGKTVRFSTPVNTMTTIQNFDQLIAMGDGADEDAVIRTLKKIKIIEAFDYIAEAEELIFKRFAGKANSQGRRMATAEQIKENLLEPLAKREVIELGTFNCYPDTDFHGEEPIQNAYKDEAYFVTEYVILDAAEKIYNRNKVS